MSGDYDREDRSFDVDEIYAMYQERHGAAWTTVTAKLPDWLKDELVDKNMSDIAFYAGEADDDE